MILGKRIQESRKNHKLTQEQLGELIDVSKVSVCQWEKNIKIPSSKNLIQLSKVLNIPLEYLIGNDTYVVSSNEENYGMMMSDEEIEIIKELRKHEKMYGSFINNPKRSIERIEKNLF